MENPHQKTLRNGLIRSSKDTPFKALGNAFRVVIEVESEDNIQDITFEKWVDKVVSSDSELTKDNEVVNNASVSLYKQRYNLPSQLDSDIPLNVKAEGA